MTATQPKWFTDALAVPNTSHFVEVQGCAIHYVTWGAREKPAILLIHGGAAHVGWWRFLAPLFTPDHYVIAMDLSGHGESGRHETYPHRVWADEVMAVWSDTGLAGKPTLIGHSMGGIIAMMTAALYGDRLAGAMVVDSPLKLPDLKEIEGGTGDNFLTRRYYPDQEAAMARFRLVPYQPCENDYLFEYVAMTSMKETEKGWTWKFDTRLFAQLQIDPIHEYIKDAKCRLTFFRGEHSRVVPRETIPFLAEHAKAPTPFIEIPDAHHHLILDQPLAFIAAARTLLQLWAQR